MKYAICLLLGSILGSLLTIPFFIRKDIVEEVAKWYKTILKILPAILTLFLVGSMITVFWLHADSFLNPPHMNSAKDLMQAILQNKAIMQVVMIGILLIAFGALSFIVRIPFMRMEHIRIFGFEYKKEADKIVEAAAVELENSRQFEYYRLAILSTISNEEFYINKFKPYIDEGMKLEAKSLVEEVIAIMEMTYREELHIRFNYEVIEVFEDVLEEEKIKHMPRFVRELGLEAKNTKESISFTDTGTRQSAVVSPILFSSAQDNSFLLVFLYSSEYTFDKTDELHLHALSNTLNEFAVRAVYERILEPEKPMIC
ncbi:hypothetical protein [Bacillus sp. 165]|uniref:hypothetical protein n=1 Tax=Bacillus sp. 165 TaxID=1529117 RepID=UPI001AD96A66|nr:hypothetical protein [Bacillus sp. 165]MBO9129038.1 hypothetical protein [Bacillus sp. 165]